MKIKTFFCMILVLKQGVRANIRSCILCLSPFESSINTLKIVREPVREIHKSQEGKLYKDKGYTMNRFDDFLF